MRKIINCCVNKIYNIKRRYEMRRKMKKIVVSLVMSTAFIATAIGTTHGMTLYGHYDISTITNLPIYVSKTYYKYNK